MSTTVNIRSSWEYPIDLTGEENSEKILATGVWNGPRAQLPVELDAERAPKRRRVHDDDDLPKTNGPCGEVEIKKTLPQKQPAETRPEEVAISDPPPRRSQSRWLKLDHRPYIDEDSRQRIQTAIKNRALSSLGSETIRALPYTYHVDLSEEEVQYVWQEAHVLYPTSKIPKDPIRAIARVLRKNPAIARLLPEKIQRQGLVSTRDELDLYYFLVDVNNGKVSKKPRVCTIRLDGVNGTGAAAQASRTPALRFRRELEGISLSGRRNNFGGTKHELLKIREDCLDLRTVWTNCAGDIATITWVSETGFICGTTEHSDAHNQQYNKPGNLLLGSTRAGTLRAYPDHRIVRPLVAKGDNASEAMRRSQDPWLYASVVSSTYNPVLDLAFTSSFDKTVKAWKVDETGETMKLAGTWRHDGIVNFVVASRHDMNFIATASDVAAKAVRIYSVNPDKVSASPFFSFGGGIGGNASLPGEANAWAYYPATIQWGLAPICSHHLLVGYSPRSLTGDENDIPEAKRTSGELRMFNAIKGSEVSLGIPMCQDIFEVSWHPTRPVFIVAMTVGSNKAEPDVRTQIRIFALSTRTGNVTSTPFRPESSAFAAHMGVPDEFYGFTMVLDCFSSDINELTISPNSPEYFYATAACTDGRVYVWDTAQGHRPIHILSHGKPVEEYNGEREREDTGSKFTAWGSTPDRLYTGGSDGVVKVWNIRNPHPFVRDLVEVSGPVSAGAFSADKRKLAIGDDSGRVYLLSVDEDDGATDDRVQLPLSGGVYGTTARTRSVNRPRPYIPHPEPAPPPGYFPDEDVDPDSGVLRGRMYLERKQLVRHKNPVLGVFQGPNYAEIGFYKREAHWDEDPSNPLLADAERYQQVNKLASRSSRGGFGSSRFSLGRTVNGTSRADASDAEAVVVEIHRRNCEKDLDWSGLSAELRDELVQSGVDPRLEEDYGFEYTDDSSDEEELQDGEGEEGEEGEDDEDDEDDDDDDAIFGEFYTGWESQGGLSPYY